MVEGESLIEVFVREFLSVALLWRAFCRAERRGCSVVEVFVVDFLSMTFGGDFLSGWMGAVVVCGLRKLATEN
ncbi:MAG: hypothetical protein V8Q84_10495 [Bilophila sp.]